MTVLATSTPVTVARKKAIGENLGSNLIWVPYIHYPINFGKKPVSALFNSSGEINAIHLTFAKELNLPIRPIDVKAQIINGTMLDTYGMVVAAFLVKDKANQVRFFKETFLIANVSLEVVRGMLFLILSRADVDFMGQEL